MTPIEALSRRLRRRKARALGSIQVGSGGLLLLGGLGAGAALGHFFDPARGAHRRSLLRDQLVHAGHRTHTVFLRGLRDLGYRARGIAAEASAAVNEAPVPDEVLAQRVRAKLGHVTSHPHPIQVLASQGRITLQGLVLAREAGPLLARVRRVRGVRGIEDRLERRADATDPRLQGGIELRRPLSWVQQQHWPPAYRVLSGAAGGALLLGALRRRGALGAAAGAVGAAALLRATTDKSVRQLLGLNRRRGSVEFRRTLAIAAPVDEVFAHWTAFESFPRIMSHVREVRRTAGDKLRWTVAGPGGLPVQWDAQVTQLVTNEVVAWRSAPGALIENAGVVRFAPTRDGGTLLDILLHYTPPAGVLGHAVAAFFRADPKHAMDDDLIRFKSLLERGKTRAHGAAVTRGELAARRGN